ncbi:MAG: OmpH family outer membrane protein [Flavobacteriales bacterium]
MNTLKAALTIGTLLMFNLNLLAQKLGHINGQKLVEHMPEYKTAYEELNTYKQQYEEALKKMQTEYESMITEYQKSEQAGNTPKVILEQKVRDIEAKRQGILDFQEQASADVQNEEQRKLEPILNKAKDAIEAVAKAQNFTYVFDASSGTLLYMGGEDVTKQVCSHMGIPDYSTEPEKK